MLFELLSDVTNVPEVLLVVKNAGATSEVKSNSLSIRQKEKWITIGDNEGPAHLHINSDLISHAEFITEEKPERTSFSVRFFDKDNNRILGAFFTKMYDENKNLIPKRLQFYNSLKEKYGSKIQM